MRTQIPIMRMRVNVTQRRRGALGVVYIPMGILNSVVGRRNGVYFKLPGVSSGLHPAGSKISFYGEADRVAQ